MEKGRFLMVLESIACHGRDRMMNVVFAEKMMETREFFQTGEQFFYAREAGRGFF